MLRPVTPRPAFALVLSFLCAFSASAALSTVPNWTYVVPSDSTLGESLAYVGDVNGDGFGDVVAGGTYAPGLYQGGRAELFPGSATGLAATPAWHVDATQANEFLGYVQPAGDVNGDGYDDVLVGSSGYDNGSLVNAGKVQLFAGGPSGLSAAPIWSVVGDQAYGILGSMAGIGDVNGDGYDDIAVAAQGYDDPDNYEGRAWVHYGSPTGPGPAVWDQQGNLPSAAFGATMTGGDVNADGYSDLILAAPHYGANFEGRVFVYAGSASGLATTPMSALAGPTGSGSYGNSLAYLGDVNGDGYGDVAIGDTFWDNSGSWGTVNTGAAYVHLGSPSGLSASPAWWSSGWYQYDYYGGVAAAGDVNRDGLADLFVYTNALDRYRGAVYLHLGQPDGISSGAPWSIVGQNENDAVGRAVAAGDMTGDGKPDVIVGHGATPQIRAYYQCPALPAPASAAVSASGVLTWNAPSGGAPDRYRIYRDEAGCSTSTSIAEVPGGTTTFTDPAYTSTAFYSVTALSADGCESPRSNCTTSSTCTIAPPTILFEPTSLCENGATGNATVENAPQYMMWTWSIENGVFTTPSTDPYVSFRATSSLPVRLSVTVMDGNRCSGTNSVDIPVRTIAPPTILFTPAAVCENGATGNATVENAPQYGAWSWTIQNGVFTTPSTDPYVSFRATSSQPVQLSVIVTDGSGCTSSASTNVPIRTIPPPTILFTPDSVCENGTTGEATVENAPQYGAWSWTIQNGVFTSPANNPSVSFRATSSQPVQLSVIVTDGSGCTSSASTNVPIRTIPPPTILFTPDSVCENGTAGEATVENAPQYGAWSWTIQNGVFTSPANNPNVSFRATSSQPVQLSVVVTDGSGCTSSASTNVPIRTIPPPTILFTPDSVCENGTTGEATVENAPQYGAWSWAIQNGVFTSPANNPSVSFRATSSQPVQLSVIVTDPSGCTSSASTNVPIRTIPPPTILFTPDSVCENGASGMATVENAPQYASWTWSIANGVFTSPATNAEVTFQATSSQPVQLSVVVTSPSGCTASSSTAVPIRTIAAPQISVHPATLCPSGEGRAAVVDGAQYAQWVWTIQNGVFTTAANLAEVGFRASGSAPVQLSVTVTDAGGCSASSSTTVPMHEAAPPTITASGPTTFCEGESVVLSAPEGYTSYEWLNGSAAQPFATSRAITVTQYGHYSVRVRTAAGCSVTSAPTTVNVRMRQPVPAITASGPTTFCDGGSVTLSAPDYQYSYLWSTGERTPSITVDRSAVVWVEVSNMEGCPSRSESVTVTEVAPLSRPTITASGPTTFCEGGSVEVTAHVTGGTGNYEYQWYSTGTPIPGATSRTYVATGRPSYVYVKVTDSGCESMTSEAVVFTVKPRPDATITVPATACAGSTQTASVPYMNGATYNWSVSGGTVIGQMASELYFTAGASGAVSLNVTITSADGCTSSGSATVAIDAVPDATIAASGPTTFCDGGSVTLTAPAGMSAYEWSNGSFERSIVASSSGTYSVTVRNASGCASSSSVTVTENAPLGKPTVTASGSTTLCPGGSVTLTATGSGGSGNYVYQWYEHGTIISGATSRTYTARSDKAYTVVVTDSLGCSSVPSDPVNVTSTPNPSAAISAPADICGGASATASVFDQGAGATYAWTISGGTITANNGHTITFTAGASGNVTLGVTVTTANGCTSSNTATVVVNPTPEATITPSGPTTFCDGGSVTLTAPAGVNATYAWSNGQTGQSITVTRGGEYWVTVTSAKGCSSARSASVFVTVNERPQATFTAPTSLCANGNGQVSVADAGAGATYQWSIDNGTIVAANGRTVDFQAGSSGSSTLTVTITTAQGCSTTASTSVAITPNPSAVVTAPARLCKGASGTASVPDAGAGATYQWTINGGTIVANGGRSVTFTGTDLGGVTLGVVVTTASGCSSSGSAAVAVDANPDATISASGPTTFCAGGSVTLTAPAGMASYLWSNGANGASITVSQANEYSVTVTNANGCTTRSNSVFVTVNAQPNATITAPSAICAGTTASASVADAGTGATYAWTIGGGTINGASNARTLSFTAGASGSVSLGVTVTTAQGCSTSGSATVAINPLPAVTIAAPAELCEGTTGSASVADAGAGATYVWTISGGTISGASNGSTVSFVAGSGSTVALTATVTNAQGCSTTASRNVTVRPATTITQQPQSVTIVKNNAATLSVTATGSGALTYQWYRGTSPNTASPISGATASSYNTGRLGRGTYTYWVRVTGSCGVANSTTATVTVN